MRKLHISVLVIVAVSTLIITALVFAVPDTKGELRTELVPGDFIELTSNPYKMTYTIIATNGDELTVHVVQEGKSPWETTETMTKEKFLSTVYLKARDNKSGSVDSRMIVSSKFGQVLCFLYVDSAMNSFWVDSNYVIYRSFVGGVGLNLTDTSLFGPPPDVDDGR